jgi:hypothetical protein
VSARLGQLTTYVQRRRFSHVVGVGLEGEAKHRNTLACKVADSSADPFDQLPALPRVGFNRGLDDQLRCSVLSAKRSQRAGILRET